jgi:LAS superfamily LD-carboxypeptidase LdcB
MESSHFTLEPRIITSILNTFQAHLDDFTIPLITYNELKPILNHEERSALAAIMLNLKPATPDTVKHYDEPSSTPLLAPPHGATSEQRRFVYISPKVQTAFTEMAIQLKADTGKDLQIVSGYRSPTYQALLLCGTYYRKSFNLSATLREIHPPGYSDHQDELKPAIDLSGTDTELPDEEFMTTIYPWLQQHANAFGFVESYPQTQSAMIWEPWHWKLQ